MSQKAALRELRDRLHEPPIQEIASVRRFLDVEAGGKVVRQQWQWDQKRE